MPMNGRLLRPRDTFTPRSISGLALWLDAADSQTLYTTDAGPVTAVSSPLDIAGCALWLDGADSSAASMTLDGTAVGSWRDKSGNGRDFTATGSARPTLTSSVINGRSAVTFNGSTTTMAGNTAAQGVIRNLPGYTVFSVLRTASVAAGERLAFGVGATVLFRIGQQDSRPLTGGRRVPADLLEAVTDASGTLSVGVAFIQSATVNHAAQTLVGLRNGSAFGTDAPYVSAGNSLDQTSSVCVGTQGDGTYGPWNGEVAELIVYPTALSTADRARVEAYLAAKWGIAGVHAPATATNDPVGAWLDKSGNGRHATQGTGGSRPRIASSAVNGRRVTEWHSSTSTMSIASTSVLASAMSMFAVLKRGPLNWGGGGASGFGSVLNATNSAQGPQLQVENGIIQLRGGSNLSSFTPSGVVGVTQHAVISGVINNLATSLYANAALVDADAASGSAGGVGSVTAIGPYNSITAAGGPLNAEIAELITYSRVLSNAERRRIERYLAAKWGITLAPQVSNVDAQDWINRVYANGGTVSATTANAVNQFCVDIENAGIRDRFYRLNLFCGNSDASLAAVRTPLFRGPSLTGTQYGNAIDTNINFVQGDYAENAGLSKGELQAKHLDTGLATSALPTGVIETGHLSAWHGPVTANFASDPTVIGAINSTVDRATLVLSFRTSETAGETGRWGKGTTVTSTDAPLGLSRPSAFVLTQRTSATNLEIWRNGAIVAAIATSTTGIAGITHNLLVFRQNNTGVVGGELNMGGPLRHYSIGDDMTSAQVLAFRAALSAFNTAMGRTA